METVCLLFFRVKTRFSWRAHTRNTEWSKVARPEFTNLLYLSKTKSPHYLCPCTVHTVQSVTPKIGSAWKIKKSGLALNQTVQNTLYAFSGDQICQTGYWIKIRYGRIRFGSNWMHMFLTGHWVWCNGTAEKILAMPFEMTPTPKFCFPYIFWEQARGGFTYFVERLILITVQALDRPIFQGLTEMVLKRNVRCKVVSSGQTTLNIWYERAQGRTQESSFGFFEAERSLDRFIAFHDYLSVYAFEFFCLRRVSFAPHPNALLVQICDSICL